jgi:3-hexulose-6-phosphate synthase
VLCDAKIADAAFLEASLAFEAGADIVTVLGLSDDSTIRGAVDAARTHGGRVMADLLNVPRITDRARELETAGIDLIAVHTGVDQQAQGRTPLEDLRLLTASGLHVPVAVAGGITASTASEYLSAGAAVLIVGSAITKASSPVAEAVAIRRIIDQEQS